jgi:Acetyltransferase (GNAT) family
MKLVVRCARADEVSLVADVLLEAASWLEARGARLWEADELAVTTLTPEIAAGHYYLAFAADSAVGVLRFTLDDRLFWPEAEPGEAAYVHRLAVRRSWAGGIASTPMLTWAADEAVRRGCAYLRLDCVASRPKLRAIYERFGFRYHSDQVVGPYHVARYELPLAKPGAAH